MVVNFPPDVESQLEELAASNGKNAVEVVQETIGRMLAERAAFLASVQEGIDQADRGELIEHEEVLERVARLFR